MLKKSMTIIMAALMIAAFAGCSSGNGDSSSQSASSSAQSSAVSVESTDSAESAESTDTASSTDEGTASSAESETASSDTAEFSPNANGKLDTTDLFSKRDLKQTPDTSDAKTIQASDNNTETITEEGTYILTGTASNFTVRVEADNQAKVQIVLQNVNITNVSNPVIYVVSADKCFVTTAEGESTLSVTGQFTADGTTNTDAVIFSKDDIVLNGTGTLNITSTNGNAVSGKDDIKVTGGTYNITCGAHAFEGKDSVSVYDGTFNIKAGKDGFHSENSDDDTKGQVYIYGGKFTIEAESDGFHAITVVQIDGGEIEITAREGIEGTYIQINGGNITINASDDGINASQKSKSFGTPTAEFTGGTTKITVGQGDTDAVDANGDVIVSGGTIDITSTVSSFDYDGNATYTGGTIIINGSQVDSIPEPAMMGGPGGEMGGRMGEFPG